MTITRLLLIALCFVHATTTWAKNEQSLGMAAGVAGFDTNIVWQIHDNGNFRSTVTNYGYFGTVNERLRDSSGELVPVLESPPRSGIEYLFEGGLWIGGVVGGDTLVSTGSLGFGVAHELYADLPTPPLTSDALGDEELTFVYGDTTTDPETVREDSYDGQHRPLPVRVRQKSYVVDATLGNAGVFVELTITNVGDLPIESLWVGWMIDPGIGHEDTEDYWNDDITGHQCRTVPSETGGYDLTFAWAMDNDGDPDSSRQFDALSPRRALVSMYLDSEPKLTGESYNWWVPSTRAGWDWGPQMAPGDLNVIGGRGYPLTDAYRYRLLSNREIDYPMPYAAVDRTAEGWIPPTIDSIARQFADGFDARFLHSVGSIDLEPRDSLVIHWVVAVTRNAHNNPEWFALTFNANDPSLYLSGLGPNTIGFLMADLKTLWDEGFASFPIRAPQNFRVSSWDSESGTLRWTPRGTLRLGGYQILQTSNELPPSIVAMTVPPGESTYVSTGLNRSAIYYYSIASINGEGAVGPYSDSDSLLPDRPMTPTGLSARGRRNAILLEWPSNAEPDIRGYRVYRREPDGDWNVLEETPRLTTLVDSAIQTARVYEYRVTALSASENESYPSGVSSAVAFSFSGPPQIVDYTPDGPLALTDKDSLAAACESLLEEAAYRDVSGEPAPLGLPDFDPHPVSVVLCDGRVAIPEADYALLDLYSNAQGITIISGRDLFNDQLVLDSLVTLPANSIGYKAGIRKAFYPRTLLASPTRMNAEFVGAKPVDPALPRLDVDSTRTAWGLNPVLPHPGNAIPFVGYFEVDTSVTEVLYSFVSRDGAASPLHGKPVAVMSKEPGRALAVFAFPLSYIEYAGAKPCLVAVLARMGYGSTTAAGDADNDGVVTVADVVSLIDYLFRDGHLLNERNADVNGDCRVDVVDVIYVMDHVYHGQDMPTSECP